MARNHCRHPRQIDLASTFFNRFCCTFVVVDYQRDIFLVKFLKNCCWFYEGKKLMYSLAAKKFASNFVTFDPAALLLLLLLLLCMVNQMLDFVPAARFGLYRCDDILQLLFCSRSKKLTVWMMY